MALWILSGVALIVALVALGTARRAARKLDALNQSYWELRYDYTRLRSRVAQLAPNDEPSDPERPQPATTFDSARPPAPFGAASSASTGRGAGSEGVAVSFIPLSAIRRKDQ